MAQFLSLGKMNMESDLISDLMRFGTTLIVALLVWSYYRRRTFALTDRYATFGPRFWTGAVDSCVLWPVTFSTAALLSLNLSRVVAAALVAVESFAWLLYTVMMHARYGQTVGKMVTKVRVVDFRTEGRISFRQAWLREGIPMVVGIGLLGYQMFEILTGSSTPLEIANGEALVASKPFWLLSALPGFWFLAEVLTMFTNEKRRALHDFIAGTVVVRTNTEDGSAREGVSPNDGSVHAPLASMN